MMAAKRTGKLFKVARKVVKQLADGCEKEDIPAEPLAQAFQYFGLEPGKLEHRELLLQALANEISLHEKEAGRRGK